MCHAFAQLRKYVTHVSCVRVYIKTARMDPDFQYESKNSVNKITMSKLPTKRYLCHFAAITYLMHYNYYRLRLWVEGASLWSLVARRQTRSGNAAGSPANATVRKSAR